jgi:hypothetical protein
VPGRPEIVRLLALSAFISVVALATWLAELSRALVIVTIAAALAVAWTIEWLAWRETRLRLSQARAEEGDEFEEPPWEEPVEAPAPVAERAPAPVAERAPSERSWFALRKTASKHEREDTAREPSPAAVAPVVEGRARVMPAKAARTKTTDELESAEPAVSEREPAAREEAPAVTSPVTERTPLRSVPPPPAPAPEHVPEERAPVVNLAARTRGPRVWNLWELERLAREEFEGEALEQSRYLLIHLRQFARADGALPLEFDELVRDSFGSLLEGVQHA